jgi:ubiquinone/menaquinone biosynthesis C-methylase UbiE
MDRYKLIINAFDSQAQAYQDKFMHLDLYNETYDAFCNHLKNDHAGILEIACGPGNITQYVLSKKPGLRIEGIDLSPNMIRLAEQNNPTAKFHVMDCRNIDQLNGSYDAVLCGFCHPYLSREECVKFFRDCNRLLHDNGILYYSCIEGDYEKSGYSLDQSGKENFYTYYHDKKWLNEAARSSGFENIGFWRIDYPEKDGTVSQHLVFLVRK